MPRATAPMIAYGGDFFFTVLFLALNSYFYAFLYKNEERVNAFFNHVGGRNFLIYRQLWEKSYKEARVFFPFGHPHLAPVIPAPGNLDPHLRKSYVINRLNQGFVTACLPTQSGECQDSDDIVGDPDNRVLLLRTGCRVKNGPDSRNNGRRDTSEKSTR